MKFYPSLLAILFTLNLHAQGTFKGVEYPNNQEEISAYLSLDQKQNVELQRIIERRANQIAEVSQLKTTDLNLYIQKRKAIRNGFFGGISLILREEQEKEFRSLMGRVRTSDYLIRSEYEQAGKSEQDIALALAEN